jgi:hypothetical protein
MNVSSADENLGGEEAEAFFSAAGTEAHMHMRETAAMAGKQMGNKCVFIEFHLFIGVDLFAGPEFSTTNQHGPLSSEDARTLARRADGRNGSS